jgi:hypothetical protein
MAWKYNALTGEFDYYNTDASKLDEGTIPIARLPQEAAVADATGAGDVVARLNELLARIRTLGLIGS